MFHNLESLAAHDHFTSPSTAPARPRRYLEGAKGLLPISCTLYVYKDLPDALSFTARSLKVGSGVKAVFEKDFKIEKLSRVGRLVLTCREDHPDFPRFPLTDTDPTLEIHRELVVQDSMETEKGLAGECGIIQSWEIVYNLLKQGRNVRVNLSNLRPAGSTKSDGYNVTSSGPASFAQIYLAMYEFLKKQTVFSLLQCLGVLNAVILKGGHKRGIVTSMMSTDCPLINEYIDAPTSELEGSHKKGFIVTQKVATQKKYAKLREKIFESVNLESSFLQKDVNEMGLEGYSNTWSNVCVGIFLPDRGTCLIWRVNLGLIDTEQELVDAFRLATEQAVSLHKIWHDNQPKEFRGLWQPMENDRQIAIDVVGLANFLARKGISYADFIEQLEDIKKWGYKQSAERDTVVSWLARAYRESTEVAQELSKELGLHPFERLHTVEPAQSHAFELTDLDGFTTCRGIWPPFDQVVNRISDNEKNITVDHGDVEIVTDLGPDLMFKLNDLWQWLMGNYGLPHAISMDAYSYLNESRFTEWWESGLLTQYYQFAGSYDQTYARKQVAEVEIEGFCSLDPSQREGCSVCAQ